MNTAIGRDWEIIERGIFTPEEIAKAEHKASIISKRVKVKVENKRPQKSNLNCNTKCITIINNR